ncbi:MAG: hypothetical protein ACLGPM_05470 [Acidobacteriota bacterium]
MKAARLWTWHMAAGVVLFFVLGLHMGIMHLGEIGHWFAPYGNLAVSIANSRFRDGMLTFTVGYIALLAIGLFHGLYGLRTMLLELTLRPAMEKAITVFLLILGIGLVGLGTWAAVAAHGVALAGVKG